MNLQRSNDNPPVIATPTQASQPQRIERSWFLESVSEVAQFAGRLGKNFVRVLITGEAVVLLVIIVVYFATRGEPSWRAPVALAFTALIGSALTFAIAVNLSGVLSLAQTVRAKSLAKRTLDALFAELLGVTPDKPEGNLELTRSLHGMPIDDLRGKLRQAGEAVLSHSIALALPSFIRWLVKKAQAILVWATVWVVTAYATAKSDRDRKVDLLALRASLTEVVDALVTQRITEGAIRFGMIIAVLFCLAAWGLVTALLKFWP